jgi:hypothetical protein
MHKPLPAFIGVSLVMLMFCCTSVLPAASQAVGAVGVTFYKIQSRWYPNEFLHEANGVLRYGTGNGAAYLWSLENVADAVRIRNKATGHWMVVKDGASAVACDNVGANQTSHWMLDTVAGPWQSLQSKANSKFLNIEKRAGVVECDLAGKPTDKTLWSAQWNLIHVEGPPPPPIYRRNIVSVVSPAYGSDVEGDTTIKIKAPGLKSASVKCWKEDADSLVATVDLNEQGEGSFVFPAKQYPHGPITVRISGTNGAAQNEIKDNCYLQLWNKSGLVRKAELRPAPPGAAGLKLIYADEFTGPLSISKTGAGATYASHKPGGGDFSGIPFGDHETPETPFMQRENYLRIRADEKKNTTGLISSLRFDGTGFTATAPCYFECRFLAQSAPGTWPAFWVMTKGVYKGLKEPADELDVIEAYGGEGPGNPNQRGYWIASHYWNQGPNGDKDKSQPGVYEQIPMTELKGASGASWFETFHTYGIKITPEDTIYYCDNIEVKRHKTARLSRQEPFFFFVNLAIGGTSGWAKDLSRYGGIADMYVDYVRVYGTG